jgi:hypothetical protein
MTRTTMRSNSTQRVIVYIALVLVGGMLSACGSENESTGSTGWEVRRDALTLQQNLQISEGDDFFFGNLTDIAVARDGRMYVADGEARHVKVLSPDGVLRDSVGSQGEGPGEFRRLSEIAIARGDSLYVLDGYNGRVHVFRPDHTLERSFLARTDQGGPDEMMMPSGPEASRDQAFLCVYSPVSMAVVQENARVIVRPVRLGGRVGDTLFTTRPYRVASKELGEGRMLFISIPFVSSPNFALGPEGRVHYAWSDSLMVTAYGADGQAQRTVSIPFEPVPVTDAEIEEALEGRTRVRDLVRSQIPETKPAFERFLVGPDGRYWFKRVTATPDTADWWIADPETRQVDVVSLPSTVDLLHVDEEQVYGRRQGGEVPPTLVRYRIE